MSDSPPSTAWPAICGVLAVICCLSIAAIAFLFKQAVEANTWKRRWNDDTKFFADEVKVVAQRIADEASARAKAEAQVAVLQAQVDDLKRQLAAEPILATPPKNSP